MKSLAGQAVVECRCCAREADAGSGRIIKLSISNQKAGQDLPGFIFFTSCTAQLPAKYSVMGKHVRYETVVGNAAPEELDNLDLVGRSMDEIEEEGANAEQV